MTFDPSSWLPGHLGILTILKDSVAVRARRALNFVGFSVTSNADTDAIDVELDDETKAAAGLQPTVAMAGLEVDWSLGHAFTKTLVSGPNTITFANVADGRVILLVLTGSSSTVSFPSDIEWPDGIAPTLTASGKDLFSFSRVGGVTYGFFGQAMAPA